MSLNYTIRRFLIVISLYINNLVNTLLTSLHENTLIYNHRKIYKLFFVGFFFPNEKLMMSGLQEILFISRRLWRACARGLTWSPNDTQTAELINIPGEFPGGGREGVNAAGPARASLTRPFLFSLLN